MRHPLLFSALLVLGCLGAKDNALFSKSEIGAGGASPGVAGSLAAQSGTGSSQGAGGAGGAGATAGQAEAPGSTGGAGSGASGSASGGVSGSSSTEGGQASVPTPIIESCDMLVGAQVNEQNHHCYRLDPDKLSFAQAREACSAQGGHLVTISDESENAFVLQVHRDDHWLGAFDGRDDRSAGVGTYSWVSAEPWGYVDWEQGQPNAHAIDCPDENGGANCYEHCGYQRGDGLWLDRACWNSIASVCEWDLGPDPEVPGQGGGP